MAKRDALWMWYPGDYEIHHALKVGMRREERGFEYPAFWRMDDCWHSVQFRKSAELKRSETIRAICKGAGFCMVDGKRYPYGTSIALAPGLHDIVLTVSNDKGLPSAYVEGAEFASGEDWDAGICTQAWVKCGASRQYSSPEADLEKFPFEYEELYPVDERRDARGTLFDFGRETFAALDFYDVHAAEDITVCYGESETEAYDMENCYIIDRVPAGEASHGFVPRAFRYIFVPKCAAEFKLRAQYEYLPLIEIGNFKCSDALLNDIWDVAAYTFHLNSREFFLDGIKRDRWVWSGDAYQSYFINRCLYMDKDICRRTIWALRGKDPIEQHINTILDYSLYWIMSLSDYYDTFGDVEFIKSVWPRMRGMMEYCCGCVNADGFITGRKGDWVFVDWADIDKDGALSAEQILFIKALEATAKCAALLGEDASPYEIKAASVRARLDEYFWDAEKGCYIDCYESGKRNVTRHANIFALLFGIAQGEKAASICKNVLDNPAVPPITTPYFKFYELWANCLRMGIKPVLDSVRDYWGGMIKLGATTMWEEFDPRQDFPRHYEMYGSKYGKSLCHAWGAGPIYLIGLYVLGLKPTAPGYATFEIVPDAAGLEWFEGTLPLPDGEVTIALRDGKLCVTASRNGGTLVYGGKSVNLPVGETVCVDVAK